MATRDSDQLRTFLYRIGVNVDFDFDDESYGKSTSEVDTDFWGKYSIYASSVNTYVDSVRKWISNFIDSNLTVENFEIGLIVTGIGLCAYAFTCCGFWYIDKCFQETKWKKMVNEVNSNYWKINMALGSRAADFKELKEKLCKRQGLKTENEELRWKLGESMKERNFLKRQLKDMDFLAVEKINIMAQIMEEREMGQEEQKKTKFNLQRVEFNLTEISKFCSNLENERDEIQKKLIPASDLNKILEMRLREFELREANLDYQIAIIKPKIEQKLKNAINKSSSLRKQIVEVNEKMQSLKNGVANGNEKFEICQMKLERYKNFINDPKIIEFCQQKFSLLYCLKREKTLQDLEKAGRQEYDRLIRLLQESEAEQSVKDGEDKILKNLKSDYDLKMSASIRQIRDAKLQITSILPEKTLLRNDIKEKNRIIWDYQKRFSTLKVECFESKKTYKHIIKIIKNQGKQYDVQYLESKQRKLEESERNAEYLRFVMKELEQRELEANRCEIVVEIPETQIPIPVSLDNLEVEEENNHLVENSIKHKMEADLVPKLVRISDGNICLTKAHNQKPKRRRRKRKELKERSHSLSAISELEESSSETLDEDKSNQRQQKLNPSPIQTEILNNTSSSSLLTYVENSYFSSSEIKSPCACTPSESVVNLDLIPIISNTPILCSANSETAATSGDIVNVKEYNMDLNMVNSNVCEGKGDHISLDFGF